MVEHLCLTGKPQGRDLTLVGGHSVTLVFVQGIFEGGEGEDDVETAGDRYLLVHPPLEHGLNLFCKRKRDHPLFLLFHCR